jgi:hypothetical protein
VHTMKRSVAFVVAALVVAGCSSDGASAPVLTSDSVAVTVPETTTSTSVPPLTSTSTTIAATTTLPPETTSTVATDDLIKQAVQSYSRAYHACGLAPATCDPSSFTASEGRSRATIAEFAQGMVDQGLYFATDLRGSYLVAESVTVTTATQASAVFCVFDAGTVLGPVGPDGQPTVVNDEVLSLRDQYDLFLDGNEWRVGEKQELQRVGEGSLCPPAQ